MDSADLFWGTQTMRIKLVSCWFNTSYAEYSNGLRKALEAQVGAEVGVIASNCGCNDPMDGVFFDDSSDYFEMPHMKYWNSTNPLKRWIRLSTRQVLYRERAKRYMQRADDAEVLHFQQTLNGYGSAVVFNWLKMSTAAARIVTVHELDPFQLDFKKENLAYNLADRIIVHAGDLRQELIDLGVDSQRIDVIPHGAQIPPVSDAAREGIVFYGGHKLNATKGLANLAHAMALVRAELGAATPVLKIHGYYGEDTRVDGLQVLEEAGIVDLVRWLDRINNEEVIEEYQRSLLCVLPFTGSFAGFAVSNAMANHLPVIGTRFAGMPEHLGDTGTFVEAGDPEQLAASILKHLADPVLRSELAARARMRAESLLSWEKVASKTIETYQRALQRKAEIPCALQARIA
jgi:glycosyltransferase involved in cell wall biosynthesis